MTRNFLLIILSGLVLSACVPIVVGGTAATGAAVITDRRAAGTMLNDKTLQMNVINALSSRGVVSTNSHANVSVYNGLVLLTGEVRDEGIKNLAQNIATDVYGVKKVVNHLVVGEKSTMMNRAYDSKQTMKVKAALTDVNIPTFSVNKVKVVTEHGVCYLMGILTEQEARAVEDIAKRVSGVAGVVTLFELDDRITGN